MKKLIVQEFVSVDGFAADAEGSTSFFETLTGRNARDIDKDLLQFISTIDTILLGANTYKMFVDYWPTATTKDEPVADALNETPKIVFSKSLAKAPWGKWEEAKVVNSDAASEIKKMKQLPGKDMVLWGSLSLVQSLLQDRLIDEFQLRVCPVALGKGKQLFPSSMAALDLLLTDSKVYESGVVFLRYKPK